MSELNGKHPSGLKATPDISRLGFLEWFRIGERERVEQTITGMSELGVSRLRVGFSWADYLSEGGREWYEWLVPTLARHAELLPCFHYTPPSMGVEPRTAAPPRDPKSYADFLDHIITTLGDHFEWVELWNEPNNLNDWDWRLDNGWKIFAEMAGGAPHWARQRGKKVALAGMCPPDPHWMYLMGKLGVLERMDAIGIHAFPDTWQFHWEGWEPVIEQVRAILHRFNVDQEVWITETGFSTWKHDDLQQARVLYEALESSAERVYWYSLHDLDPGIATQDGLMSDVRHYHMGLKTTESTPKLAYRLLAQSGIAGIAEGISLPSVGKANTPDRDNSALITGGAGFIGTNVADRLASQGRHVRILDNLSRPGVEQNVRWLIERHGDAVEFIPGDVRNRNHIREGLAGVNHVFHLAAQTAVTTSLIDPTSDFQVNAEGTLNLLEEMRRLDTPPSLLFTSTNKVYGALEDLPLLRTESRYDMQGRKGLDETLPLQLETPYGCSKGAAEQYVLDYARSYDIPAAVFRMSCIYGVHQFGTEDQGWVAHFLIRTLEGKPITLFGDGRQVRDVLFVEDLARAQIAAQEHMDEIVGEAFNIGGGPERSVSLLDVLRLIEKIHGAPPEIHFGDWRMGDQKYYVSDTSKFQAATGWKPMVSVEDGVRRLYDWLKESRPSSRAAAKTLQEVSG